MRSPVSVVVQLEVLQITFRLLLQLVNTEGQSGTPVSASAATSTVNPAAVMASGESRRLISLQSLSGAGTAFPGTATAFGPGAAAGAGAPASVFAGMSAAAARQMDRHSADSAISRLFMGSSVSRRTVREQG